MTAATLPGPIVPQTRRFHNAEEWWHSIGDVPLARVVMDPLPGTATEEDLLRLVEVDKRLCELLDGTLVEKAMGNEESGIASALNHALYGFARDNHLGWVYGEASMLRVAPGQVRSPDLAFIHVDDTPDRKRPKQKIANLRFRLAVEVLSKSNTMLEMARKRSEYFAAGTMLMWIVDPVSRTVAVFDTPTEVPARALTEQDSLDGGSVLPGFSLSVSELFKDEI